MTKGDFLKTLVTEKKREANTINKIGDVYVVMFMSLYMENWLRLKCLYTANNTYWVQISNDLLLQTILYKGMYTKLFQFDYAIKLT